MSKVQLINLSKNFGDFRAVSGLNLEIRQGEFVSLLGPSGCGKTTTLRMIAGFEFPTSGQIFFDDKEVTFLKPDKRNTGMVFQNFALFPHMTIFENVAFGLQARRINKPEIKKRVGNALALVGLQNMENRKVTEISGGQQQRVALARAIVIEPNILLLDEPLSNLDAKLREETRTEIRRLQQELGITTIYVTHDQEEALTLSDRIVVLNHGVCQQTGTPEEIYQQPVNEFVAGFVGNSNVLKGRVVRESSKLFVAITDDWKLQIADNLKEVAALVTLSIKPENLFFTDSVSDGDFFEGKIANIVRSGSVVDYQVSVRGQMLRVKRFITQADFKRQVGDRVKLSIHPEHIHIF